jgi:subtilisin family serine protease
MADPTLTATVDEMLETAAVAGTGFYTGRQIVTFKPGARDAAVLHLSDRLGMRVASAAEFTEHAVDFTAMGDAGSLVFPELNVAVVSAPVAAAAAPMMMTEALEADSPILAIEPETFVFPAADDWQAYLRGFAAAAERISSDLGALHDRGPPGVPVAHEEAAAVAGSTWGLAAIRAEQSQYSGVGIKVAVLDTGFDLNHPDFHGRPITRQSFIAGQTPQDGNGHGTHTMGTACGPRSPAGVPRYGIAYGAQMFVGKVLSNTGGGTTATVLAGMNWAVANRCHVISMSLGAPIGPQAAYTQAGQAALSAGCLMIAAAGNESRRPGVIAPTGAPGNSPTIMAVAALDRQLRVSFFSCGGKVEIAGPGENVFSSWPLPKRYNIEAGTSMATPHVSGAAALFAQSNPGLAGHALWNALVRHARHLPFPATDVGAGLVQCP